jgi:hypothetical protein
MIEVFEIQACDRVALDKSPGKDFTKRKPTSVLGIYAPNETDLELQEN